MKILHVSSFDYGGAGTAAYRLHKNLSAQGFDSIMLVLDSRSNDKRVNVALSNIVQKQVVRNLTKVWLKIKSNQNYLFQNQQITAISTKKLSEMLHSFKPDIIIAHSLTYFLTVKQLSELQKLTGAPILWYLMDMAPLTGGCHYAWDCVRYTQSCGQCPALYSINEHDLSGRVCNNKINTIEQMDLTVVAASSWLYQQAHHAAVFKNKRVEQILLAVDPDVFKPGSKDFYRQKLGLPTDKKIIFFGCQKTHDRRKGMSYLLEALKLVATSSGQLKNSIHVAVAGDSEELDPMLASLFPFTSLGYLKGDDVLASAYAASDVFVCPSIEDSGPMMINESIMCGTPVVSFEMGIAPDLVLTGKTGYRAELKNSADLARGIQAILDLSPEESRSMSESCRQLGIQLFNPIVQTDSFTRLFDALTPTA